MLLYKYKALNAEKATVNGLVEAASETEAVETLKDNGLEIISLEYKGDAKKQFDFEKFFSRIKPKDLVVFSRQFSVLISANVAMVQALKAMVDQTENLKLKDIISDIRAKVDGGSSLSEALAFYPKVFDNFFINVIKSGESSGKLDEVLSYLADEMEKEYDMLAKIKGAMIYPVFIVVLLFGVGIFMMVAVVPKLTQMLTETGVELPIATKVLIWLSGFFSKFWILIIIVAIGSVIGVRYFAKTDNGRRVIDKLLFKLPVFGNLLIMIYLVRFTRSLNVLLVGGVNLTKGLRITADVVDNTVYQDLILSTIKQVEEGNSISKTFSESPIIPKMVSHMMAVGEKTGKIDLVLEKITQFYGREIDNIVSNLMALLEPLIMVVLGLGVGGMVVAIVMPMLNLTSGM